MNSEFLYRTVRKKALGLEKEDWLIIFTGIFWITKISRLYANREWASTSTEIFKLTETYRSDA